MSEHNENLNQNDHELELKEFVRKRALQNDKDISKPSLTVLDVNNESNENYTEIVTIDNDILKEEIVVENENITKDISETNKTVSDKPNDVVVVNDDVIIETKEETSFDSNELDIMEKENKEEEYIIVEDDIIDNKNHKNVSTINTDLTISNKNEEVEIDVEEDNEEDDDYKSTSVKIGSTGERKSIKRISSFNPTNSVKVVDSDDYQAEVVSQYIFGNTNNAFVGPKSVTRIILPYSGIFYDLSSYTNSDMLGIHRSTNDITFVEKIEKELISAWKHTVNNSFKKEMDFPEWLRNIKYPDLWCIYWGIYTVNHPGINSYRSKCDYCPEEIEEKRDNYSISFVSDQSIDDIDQETIDKIRNGVDKEMIKSYRVASTLIEKENFLPEKKFKVFHGMPNMEEVMTFLKYLKVDLNEDDEIIRYVLYPISWMELEKHNISKATISKVLSYKYMLYTKKLYVPVFKEMEADKEGGKTKIKATYVDVKYIMIYPLINSLSKEDFKEFASGKELKKLLIKEGIHFRVKDSVCPKCNKKQKITALDMRDIIFTRAEALTDFLITM